MANIRGRAATGRVQPAAAGSVTGPAWRTITLPLLPPSNSVDTELAAGSILSTTWAVAQLSGRVELPENPTNSAIRSGNFGTTKPLDAYVREQQQRQVANAVAILRLGQVVLGDGTAATMLTVRRTIWCLGIQNDPEHLYEVGGQPASVLLRDLRHPEHRGGEGVHVHEEGVDTVVAGHHVDAARSLGDRALSASSRVGFSLPNCRGPSVVRCSAIVESLSSSGTSVLRAGISRDHGIGQNGSLSNFSAGPRTCPISCPEAPAACRREHSRLVSTTSRHRS